MRKEEYPCVIKFRVTGRYAVKTSEDSFSSLDGKYNFSDALSIYKFCTTSIKSDALELKAKVLAIDEYEVIG